MESSPTSGTDRDSKRLKLSTELDGSLSSQSTVDLRKFVESQLNLLDEKDPVEDDEYFYGQFITIGYNGYDLEEDGKYSVKGIPNLVHKLHRRKDPNGLKLLDEKVVQMSYKEKATPSKFHSIGSTHTMTICWSEEERGFIEFTSDPTKDQFQFGRSHNNDFVLKGIFVNKGSAMSRYSFRVECDREPPYTCRIFAGGFDETNQLFLGPSGLLWGQKRDGLITNGLRLLNDGEEWTEVSCRGHVYSMRPSRSRRGKLITEKSNELKDFSLINVGGITFMWISGPTLSKVKNFTKEDFEQNLNNLHVQCPINLGTIRFGHLSGIQSSSTEPNTPFVFPRCGHVHGYSSTLLNFSDRCTICREPGVYTDLKIEETKVLHVFCDEQISCVMNPCGHAIDLEGAKKWSKILHPGVEDPVYQVPKNALCPFCRTALDRNKPFSKLIYQIDK